MNKCVLIPIAIFLLSGCARDESSISTVTKAIQGHWNNSEDECEIYISGNSIIWKDKNNGLVYDTEDYTILSHKESGDSDSGEVIASYIDEKDTDQKTQYLKFELYNDNRDNLTLQDEVYKNGKLTDTADDGVTFDFLNGDIYP